MFPGAKACWPNTRRSRPSKGSIRSARHPPFGYAAASCSSRRSKTGSLDQDTIARYIHSHSFHTVIGDLAFGKDGEWTQARASSCSSSTSPAAHRPVPRHRARDRRMARRQEDGRIDLPLRHGEEALKFFRHPEIRVREASQAGYCRLGYIPC